ncbi:MAG: flagellar basal-body rod protein FlgF [Rhodothermales bacterium]
MLLRLQNAFRSMTSMIREQERTANNLANANTIGYKQDRTFTATLEEYLDVEGGPQSDRRTEQWASLEQGAFEATGGPLDVAIENDGFFVLTDQEGGPERYTRAGRFTQDDQGMLRSPGGQLVEGLNGPIQIPRDAATIAIQADGTIRADDQPVGTLRLVRFENPMALTRVDGAAFTADGAEPLEVEQPSVRQGFIETSNVDPIREMTEMIAHFRQFESQQKVLSTHDQILGHVTRELGKF